MKELRVWLWAAVLGIPVWCVYAAHFWGGEELLPTGFIQSDMPTYMANAREYLDHEGFRLGYSNPFSDNAESPAIYFQPHLLLLAGLWSLSGWDPGVIFCLFGLLAVLACLRVIVGLYREWVRNASWPGMLMFCWGGGVLALTGILYFGMKPGDAGGWLDNAVRFDPFDGWWFLNLGRNLVYPTEAYYHILFLGTIWAVLRKRFVWAAALAGLLSLSHPFSGVQLLLVMTAWAGLERGFFRKATAPFWFLPLLAAMLLAHLAYYLLFLGQYAEHRQVMEQWQLDWSYKIWNILPAYLLVGGLAGWALRSPERMKEQLSLPFARLCLVWFAVSFVLANHEFLLPPHQPLHFTRGYVWIPLFLLGAPTLEGIIRRIFAAFKPLGRSLLVAVLLLLGLSDNLFWFAWQMDRQVDRVGQGQFLQPEQKELFLELSQSRYNDHLLISEDLQVAYLSAVYTPLRTGYGHWASTPNAAEKLASLEDFFLTGRVPVAWEGRQLLVVRKKNSQGSFSEMEKIMEKKSWENEEYEVFSFQPVVGFN